MIVRDEAAHLPACLESIHELVDEIVIVDTGSSDDTVSIARSFGARVHQHPWRGSFAEPRNIALDLARGRWILYIDADERLQPCSVEDVRARIAQATEVALRVRLRPFVGATPYWEYRLWRSDPRIRFTGAIHEKHTPAIAEVVGADGRMIGETELFLEHVGYEGDQARKHERNLPLLRAQLAAEPANPYNWHHLAVVLDGLGKPGEAAAALEQAVEAAREEDVDTGMQAYFGLICLRRAQGEDTTELLEEALARYPDNVSLIWLEVIAEIEAGRHEQALRLLELFDVDTEMPVEDIVGYRSELFGARAAEARGVCLFKLGRYADAADAYAEAERLEPGELAHRIKRELAAVRAARQHNGSLAPAKPTPVSGFLWPARRLLTGFTIDLGGVSVELRATDAMRAAAMHALLGRVSPSERDPDVRLTFLRHRLSSPERGPDDSVGALEIWNDDDALSVAYGDCFGGRVEDRRAVLGGHGDSLSRVFRYVGPFMLASLLAPCGSYLLHAGAICNNGRAVLVLGGTGAGKSTLILGALQDGWSVLSDDLVTLKFESSRPMVTGIPRPLVVPSEVARGDIPIVFPVADPRARVELEFEAWDRGSHPISAIVVAGHGDADEALLQPIERPDLLRLLVHSALAQQPRRVRRYVAAAAGLSDLPAWRLLHSPAPDTRSRRAAEALRTLLDPEALPLPAGARDVRSGRLSD